jgi:hypothetical protein
MEAEAAAAAKPRKRRLPRGTSDYQAAWIMDDRWVLGRLCGCVNGGCWLLGLGAGGWKLLGAGGC